MVRKLALAVSLALGTVSVPVYALGLGELSSKSTLNQNFDGNIPLLSVLPEELDGVRVNLADAEIFERAGVERPFYLSLLRFEPVLTDSGKTVVRVTSEFPIREPFLNFLVEVNWPKGRLVREYTVLLDPPTTTMRRAPKVSPAATPARTAVAPPQPKPTVAASSGGTAQTAGAAAGSEYGPVRANDTAWRIADEVRPSGVSIEQTMMALLEANPQAFIGGNINRLRKGQILRVPSAPEIQQLSRQQAREAFREQQEAWLAQRNQRPQPTEAVEAAGETEVASEDAATAQPDADQLRIATARPDGEGEAGAGDDAAESTTVTDLETRLIAARENAETSRQEAEMMRSRVDDLQARLEKMQKLLSLKDEQLAQLQDRVATEGVTATPEAALEELALANQIDAAEQAAAQAAEGIDETTPSMAMAEEPATPEIASTRVVPGSDYQIEDIPPQIDPDRIVEAAERGEDLSAYLPGEMADEGGVETAGATTPEVDLPGVQADAEIVVDPDQLVPDEILAGIETSEGEPAMTQPAPAMLDAPPAAESPAAADSGPMSMIPQPIARMIEQNILPIAGAGVALLALIGWGATRRRRQAQPAGSPAPIAAAAVAAAEPKPKTKPEPEPKAEVPEPARPPVDQPVFDKEALEDLPDSTLLDDFSQSDINALQDETGEVDPVSEADVYIAYGRYQQAEELLRQALGRDPNRLALKHKLLEVHYATKNSGAFATLAHEMVEAGQDAADERAWARACDMGRDLAPDNPLFAQDRKAGLGDLAGGAGAAVATAAAAATTVDDDTLTLDDLELSELNAAYDDEPVAPDELEAPSEVSISLDLDEPSELTELVEDDEPSVETVAIADELPASIQLDELDTMEFESPKAAEPVAADSLDLDSMMAEAEAAVDEAESELNLDSEFSADDLQAQLDELSDLSVLDSELHEASEGAAEPKATLGLVAEDATPSSDNLDRPISLDEAFSVDEASEEITALDELVNEGEGGDEDDVATKLDLAKAYVDMGDEDGARSILEEVVAEGSDTQRGDAENILAKLG